MNERLITTCVLGARGPAPRMGFYVTGEFYAAAGNDTRAGASITESEARAMISAGLAKRTRVPHL